jgi:hypothetical protein
MSGCGCYLKENDVSSNCCWGMNSAVPGHIGAINGDMVWTVPRMQCRSDRRGWESGCQWHWGVEKGGFASKCVMAPLKSRDWNELETVLYFQTSSHHHTKCHLELGTLQWYPPHLHIICVYLLRISSIKRRTWLQQIDLPAFPFRYSCCW